MHSKSLVSISVKAVPSKSSIVSIKSSQHNKNKNSNKVDDPVSLVLKISVLAVLISLFLFIYISTWSVCCDNNYQEKEESDMCLIEEFSPRIALNA